MSFQGRKDVIKVDSVPKCREADYRENMGTITQMWQIVLASICFPFSKIICIPLFFCICGSWLLTLWTLTAHKTDVNIHPWLKVSGSATELTLSYTDINFISLCMVQVSFHFFIFLLQWHWIKVWLLKLSCIVQIDYEVFFRSNAGNKYFLVEAVEKRLVYYHSIM